MANVILIFKNYDQLQHELKAHDNKVAINPGIKYLLKLVNIQVVLLAH